MALFDSYSLDKKRELWKMRDELNSKYSAFTGLLGENSFFSPEDTKFFEQEDKAASLESDLKAQPEKDEMQRAQLAAVWQSRGALDMGQPTRRPNILTSPLGLGPYSGLRAKAGGL